MEFSPDVNGPLILFALSLLLLNPILRRSALVDSYFQPLYSGFRFFMHLAWTVISLLVWNSIWVSLAANVVLVGLYLLNARFILETLESLLRRLEGMSWESLKPSSIGFSFLREEKSYRRHAQSELFVLFDLAVWLSLIPPDQLERLEQNIADLRLEVLEALDLGDFRAARKIRYLYLIGMTYDTVCFWGRTSIVGIRKFFYRKEKN